MSQAQWITCYEMNVFIEECQISNQNRWGKSRAFSHSIKFGIIITNSSLVHTYINRSRVCSLIWLTSLVHNGIITNFGFFGCNTGEYIIRFKKSTSAQFVHFPLSIKSQLKTGNLQKKKKLFSFRYRL